MPDDKSVSEPRLTATQLRDLRAIAAMMIPASAEFAVPAADDPAIFADIERSLGRDASVVATALDTLAAMAALSGGAFADFGAERRGAIAASWRAEPGSQAGTVVRVILQSYYRDDRVVRSLGLEARPPFPQGNVLEGGDWSLLDHVRARPPTWRQAP
jgi:hypothetical protein